MTKTVTVVALPTASFTVSNPLCATQNVTFTSTSTPGAGNTSITNYSWSVNGTVIQSGAAVTVFNYTFPSGGSYTVALSVSTNNACNAQVTQTVNINAIPVANFT